MTRRNGPTLGLCGSLALLATVTACSGLVTAYDIPEDVCDIGLPAESYQQILPAGEKAVDTYNFSENGDFVCDVIAGRYASLRIGTTFDLDETYIDDYSGIYQQENAKIVEGQYENRVWPKHAKALVMCDNDGNQRPMNIIVRANYPTDSAKSEAALAELIQPLAAALSSHCPEGPSAAAG